MGSVGAWGKMPALGDFIRIAPPAGFVDRWDRWLQEGLSAARDRLGPRWQQCYLTAPIWRFSLAEGLAGPRAVWGVLMPSVDRVGRMFPLTLVAPIPDDAEPVRWHFSVTPAFEELEEIALDALSDTMTRDKLAQRLAAVAPSMPSAAGVAMRNGATLLVSEPSEGAALAGFAGQLAQERRARPSVWTQTGQAGTQILLEDGLPAADCVHRLFDPHHAGLLQAAAKSTG
ncbi:type VI secretion system-associated protein TagF [Rhodosalinus sp.]|uniref:type VI secretion system-associated protein TagF n=1 Tax=Rhodosalinus sp. TaxID=2047741 RepID=UPI003978F398